MTQDHAGVTTRALDLAAYLGGAVEGAGLVLSRSGTVMMRYTIAMTGVRTGSSLVIDEVCRYETGDVEDRHWHLEFAKDGTFTATADGIVGRAAGWQRSHEARMRYRYRIPRPSGSVIVSIVDRFFLIDDGTLLNTGRMTKFGIMVGGLYTSLRRAPASDAAP